MKNKVFKIAFLISIAALILFIIYKISHIGHAIEPKVCESTIRIDGILDEPDWNLEKREFYQEFDSKIKTSNFSKFQFLRDSITLYFGAQFTFDSTLISYDGGIFSFENAREADMEFQIELYSKKLSDEKRGDIEIEFSLENKNDEISSDIYCERRGSYSVCDVIEVGQNYESNTWNIELSVPLEIVLQGNEKFIAFNLEIYGGSTNESRVHILMDYPFDLEFFFNKYLVLKNLD